MFRFFHGWYPFGLFALVAAMANGCAGGSQPGRPPAAGGAAGGSATSSAGAPDAEAVTAMPPQEKTKLAISYSALTGVYAPLWITKEAGLFEKYGLQVELTYIAGSKSAGALVGRDVQIAAVGGDETVNIALSGADIVSFVSAVDRLAAALVVPPDVRGAADLRGKIVGVTSLGSTNEYGMRIALGHFGLSVPQDVTIVQTGGTPESLAAMQAGAIKGAMMQPPNLSKAKALGMTVMLELASLNVPYLSGTYAASRSFVRENEGIVRSFVKAYTEGMHRTTTDSEFTKSVIAKYTKTEDPELLDETYDFYKPLYRRAPTVSLDAIRTSLELAVAKDVPGARSARPEDFVDNRFVQELVDSGFVDRLYR